MNTSKYAYISVDEVIAKFLADTQYRDSDFFNDADFENWIWEAESLIGSTQTYIRKEKTIEVNNFRAILPCDVYKVIQLVDACNGNPLYYNGSTFIFRHRFDRSSEQNTLSRQQGRNVFSINGWDIDTDIHTGHLLISYYAFPSDDKGRPMVKNTIEHMEAIVCYLKLKLTAVKLWQAPTEMWLKLEGKYKRDWLIAIGRARGQDNMPDLSEMQYMAEIRNRMITRVDGFQTRMLSLNQNDAYNVNAGGRNERGVASIYVPSNPAPDAR